MQIEIQQKVFLRSNRSKDASGDIWFIHPFGESGLCYKEAFESVLVDNFNLFVPDLPGCGVTPNSGRPKTMDQQTSCLIDLIDEISYDSNLFLVAHSVSGLIGTQLCEHYQEKMKGYVSVEGNLLEADSYYSSLPISNSKEDFFKKYTDSVFEKSSSRLDFRRYLSSIYFADVDSLHTWGKSTEKYISGKTAASAFMNLKCEKRYIWGDKDTPQVTQEFIKNNDIPNIHFEDVGHWPMIETPEKFYNELDKFFYGIVQNTLNKH